MNVKTWMAPMVAFTLLVPAGVWAAPSPRANWLMDNAQATQTRFKKRIRRKRSPFGMNANTLTSTAMRSIVGNNRGYSDMINFAANRLSRQSGRSSSSLFSPDVLLRVFSALSN